MHSLTQSPTGTWQSRDLHSELPSPEGPGSLYPTPRFSRLHGKVQIIDRSNAQPRAVALGDHGTWERIPHSRMKL